MNRELIATIRNALKAQACQDYQECQMNDGCNQDLEDFETERAEELIDLIQEEFRL